MKHPLGENFHAVSFYEDTESLCASVVEFISEGIEAGQPALVIARPPHRAAILEALRDCGMDVDRLQAAGDLIVLDARDTLAAFFTNGQLNTAVFHEQAVQLLERICCGRTDCTIWAYGEMVDLLWEADQPLAAILLEMLWNKLAATWKLCILCGYSTRNPYRDDDITDVCGQHTHVFGADAVWKPSAGAASDHPGG